MPKVPSMSSKGLVRMLAKGGAVFVRRGQATTQYMQGLLKTKDILLRFRWERKRWTLYIAREC